MAITSLQVYNYFVSELDGTFDYDWDDYEMVLFVEGNYSTCIAVRADSPYQTINDLLTLLGRSYQHYRWNYSIRSTLYVRKGT